MERLWRLRDVVDQFQVSYTTIWRWTRSGQLQAVRLPGGQLRVKDSEIRRILDREVPE